MSTSKNDQPNDAVSELSRIRESLQSESARIQIRGASLSKQEVERVDALEEAISFINKAVEALGEKVQETPDSGYEQVVSTCIEGESLMGLGPASFSRAAAEAIASDFDSDVPTATADVFIQAGHLNTPDGATGGTGPLGREIDWTPIVTNEAVRILREAGVTVIKEDASIKFTNKRFNTKCAVFIHFDSTSPAGRAGASVGYDDDTDEATAQAWKALYSRYWSFRWMNDNYTNNLRHYYGFKHTRTEIAETVLELGDLTSLEQAQWLKPRLKWLGALVAHFLSTTIEKGDVPDPGEFEG